MLENKVRAPARAGAIAPLSVIVPAQNTGLGPEKTSFFQALSIPTKISKGSYSRLYLNTSVCLSLQNTGILFSYHVSFALGQYQYFITILVWPFLILWLYWQYESNNCLSENTIINIIFDYCAQIWILCLFLGTIEIINDVHILKPGDKVGASEATLLNMLNISPFSYGLLVEQVYDSGTIFAPEILDIKPEDLRAKFMAGVANLAAVSLEIGYPTVASAPHSIANGFKNLLAIAATTEVEFKEATTIKEFIKVHLSRRYLYDFYKGESMLNIYS